MTRWWMALAGLLSGAVFGVGLTLSQMVDPRKVLAFLDVAGAWDLSLAFVMAGAVPVAALGYALLRRRRQTWLGGELHWPRFTRIDAPLLCGAALFGLGWGLAGYCPGPVLASLALGNAETLWFVPAMVLGMGLGRWQIQRTATA